MDGHSPPVPWKAFDLEPRVQGGSFGDVSGFPSSGLAQQHLHLDSHGYKDRLKEYTQLLTYTAEVPKALQSSV